MRIQLGTAVQKKLLKIYFIAYGNTLCPRVFVYGTKS